MSLTEIKTNVIINSSLEQCRKNAKIVIEKMVKDESRTVESNEKFEISVLQMECITMCT